MAILTMNALSVALSGSFSDISARPTGALAP